MSDHFPIELKRSNDDLQITWSDQVQQSIAVKELRDRCPCARCMKDDIDLAEGNSQGQANSSNPLAVLSLEKTQPISIVSMTPVGNYAYNIGFSDGHNTGIFTFDFLRALI